MSSLQIVRAVRSLKLISFVRCMSTSGFPGSGVGKGGGSGGSVRDSGGSLGEREAAIEEEYFHRLTQAQFDEYKSSLFDQISYHKDEITDHQKSIERHKRKIGELQDLARNRIRPVSEDGSNEQKVKAGM